MDRHPNIANLPPVRLMLAGGATSDRQALGALLATRPGVTVVAAPDTVTDAPAVARTAEPDIVLFDVQLPSVAAVLACRALRSELPVGTAVLLSAHADFRSVAAIVMAAADGHVLKTLDLDTMSDTIVAVARRETELDPRIGEALVDWFREHGIRRGTAPARSPLTPYESQLLTLVAHRGLDRDIAAELERPLADLQRDIAMLYTAIGDDPGYRVMGNSTARQYLSP